MVEKGVGSYQIHKFQKSEGIILKALEDGKWHRYQELVQLTALSQPTLSKHLKDLEKGIVERKLDASGSEYPYPVFYRIKPRYVEHDKDWKDWGEDLIESDYDDWVRFDGLHRYFEYMNEMLSLQALLNLKYYFGEEKNNEQSYEQATQAYVISVFENALRNVKDQLKEISKKGENVEKIIDAAMGKLIDHYDVWYPKSKSKRKKIARP